MIANSHFLTGHNILPQRQMRNLTLPKLLQPTLPTPVTLSLMHRLTITRTIFLHHLQQHRPIPCRLPLYPFLQSTQTSRFPIPLKLQHPFPYHAHFIRGILGNSPVVTPRITSSIDTQA